MKPKYQQPWNIKVPEELKDRIYDIDKYREYEHNRQLKTEWVEKYSTRERWLYCTFQCPVSQRCKFENRYKLN